MNETTFVRIVDNGARAMEEVYALQRQGYLSEDIYVLAHDRERTSNLANTANVNTISLEEEGLIETISNLFRSRGEELRAKMESMGLSPAEADRYEAELDRGKVIVLARHRTSAYRY